ncbi:hypothetical protein [Maritalea sp.]|uniref:hypothetical protein n=1 Tax=Maritalea sp. TaxID=2003361 RepID=UPI003EF8C3D0
MSSLENQFLSRLDQLVSTATSRVRSNTVLLVAALATGTTAYIAILMAIWFALVERTSAVQASLSLALITAVLTFVLIGIKSFRDRQKQRKQTELQSQVVMSLLQTVLGKTTKSNLSAAPLAAIVGWAIARKSQSDRSYRKLTH